MNNYAVNIQNNGQMIPVAGALLMDPASGTTPAPNYGINFQVNGQKAPVFAMIVIDPATGLPASIGGGGGGTPGGADTQIQFNDGGAFSGSSGFTFDKVKKAIALAGAVLTAATPVLDLSVGWNSGATTFTAFRLDVADTSSAAGSLLADFKVGGVSKFAINKTGTITVANAATFGNQISVTDLIVSTNSGVIAMGASGDVKLYRDAANTLALRNSTNAQTFNVYNTYTDASNYERAYIRANAASHFDFGTENAGTGSARDLWLFRGGVNKMQIGTDVVSLANVLFGTDNSYDIGASGANRPRNVYVANTLTTGGITTGAINFAIDNSYDIGQSAAYRPRNVFVAGNMTAGNAFVLGSNIAFTSFATGQLTIQNGALNNFDRMNLGGTTSSFPAIKRNGAGIDFRLADDSAYAAVTVQSLTSNGGNVYFAVGGDTVLSRVGVGIIKIASNTTSAGAIVTDPKTVANLPSAATAGAGARAFVTDANATTFGTTVAGSGPNKVPVYSDGTNWLIG